MSSVIEQHHKNEFLNHTQVYLTKVTGIYFLLYQCKILNGIYPIYTFTSVSSLLILHQVLSLGFSILRDKQRKQKYKIIHKTKLLRCNGHNQLTHFLLHLKRKLCVCFFFFCKESIFFKILLPPF